MTHTLIVTKIADENDDDIEYTVDGPHDTSCQVWYACSTCANEPSPYTRAVDDPICDEPDWTFHDVEHRWIGDEWMTLSTECAGTTDGAQDDLNFIANTRGIGSHLVNIDYWGDGCWQALALTDNEVPA